MGRLWCAFRFGLFLWCHLLWGQNHYQLATFHLRHLLDLDRLAHVGADALEQGTDVKVATWSRMAPNTLPAMAKSTANYANSQLIKMEALLDGFAEGIALDIRGYISEGSGENIFVYWNGKLITPSPSSDILESVTRDTIMRLHEDMTGMPVIEREIDRTEIYLAEEAFVCGTGQELLPVTSIDKLPVGGGQVGELTKKLRQRYFDIVRGEAERDDLFDQFLPLLENPWLRRLSDPQMMDDQVEDVRRSFVEDEQRFVVSVADLISQLMAHDELRRSELSPASRQSSIRSAPTIPPSPAPRLQPLVPPPSRRRTSD